MTDFGARAEAITKRIEAQYGDIPVPPFRKIHVRGSGIIGTVAENLPSITNATENFLHDIGVPGGVDYGYKYNDIITPKGHAGFGLSGTGLLDNLAADILENGPKLVSSALDVGTRYIATNNRRKRGLRGAGRGRGGVKVRNTGDREPTPPPLPPRDIPPPLPPRDIPPPLPPRDIPPPLPPRNSKMSGGRGITYAAVNTGYGRISKKRPLHLVKGTPQAKAYMAYLRSRRKQK